MCKRVMDSKYRAEGRYIAMDSLYHNSGAITSQSDQMGYEHWKCLMEVMLRQRRTNVLRQA